MAAAPPRRPDGLGPDVPSRDLARRPGAGLGPAEPVGARGAGGVRIGVLGRPRRRLTLPALLVRTGRGPPLARTPRRRRAAASRPSAPPALALARHARNVGPPPPVGLPVRPPSRYAGRMLKRLRDALEAQLPPPGPARWATLAMLATGGLVAIAVPIVFAVMLVAMLRAS